MEVEISCNICKLNFKSNETLKRHKKYSHNKTHSENKSNVETKMESNENENEDLDLDFEINFDVTLEKSIKRERQEHNKKCDLCEKEFNKAEHLHRRCPVSLARLDGEDGRCSPRHRRRAASHWLECLFVMPSRRQ